MPTRQEGGFNEFTIHLVKLNKDMRNNGQTYKSALFLLDVFGFRLSNDNDENYQTSRPILI